MELKDKIFEMLDFRNGVYIEAGANNGVSQSNTWRLFTEKDWTGLLVEPSPNAYAECLIKRSKDVVVNRALVSFDYNQPTISGDFDGNMMSSVNGMKMHRSNMITVKCATLTSILEQYKFGKIDFFSLDAEGYELQILKGLDFKKYSPTFILIEIWDAEMEELCALMSNNNYDMVCNMTNFNKIDNPFWDGTHNDYLFKLKAS